jgi:hypothetical protein
VDLNLTAFLCLEFRDLLSSVSLEQEGVAPLDLLERPRSDELRSGVKGRSNLVRRVVDLGQEAAKIS